MPFSCKWAFMLLTVFKKWEKNWWSKGLNSCAVKRGTDGHPMYVPSGSRWQLFFHVGIYCPLVWLHIVIRHCLHICFFFWLLFGLCGCVHWASDKMWFQCDSVVWLPKLFISAYLKLSQHANKEVMESWFQFTPPYLKSALIPAETTSNKGMLEMLEAKLKPMCFLGKR